MNTKEYLKKLNIVFAKLSNDFNQDFFRIVGKEFGYFDLPKKVSLQDVVGKKVFYRGVKQKIYLKELLVDEFNNEFFIGNGTIGEGFYSSERKEGLSSYYSHNEENMLKFYLKKCNMIDFHDFFIFFDYFRVVYHNKTLTKKEKKAFEEIIETNERFRLLIEFIDKSKYKNYYFAELARNSSALAVFLGYDVIINSRTLCDDFLILNRSKIVVTDKEFKRVTGIETKRVKRTTSLSNLLISQKGE